MGKEPFLLNDKVIELEVKPITMIFKSPDVNGEVEPLKRIVLDPQVTIYHAERVKNWHKQTEAWTERIKKGSFSATDSCAMHLKGLVDLSLKLAQMGIPFMWRYPETFLHPKQQAELADFLIHLTGPEKDK